MNLSDLDAFLNRDVPCPTCEGAGFVEEPYGPCPRCGRAGTVPFESLTEYERVTREVDEEIEDWSATLEDGLEEQDDPDGELEDDIPPARPGV